ncbi:gamma-glutamylcyclotransferase [Haloechinothrix sp. YIM 98757]|uniref:Gamma-glutamylcyclotransferase n=1 Tax=Haloechinothrix aidingensis TaxID=2752311 RepID=A0A838A7L5_9PSEU|nr:gamma-glutamylcyclotransferase [Haloechinothrix aidingensis]MBA0124142.1 gamma-glutamylcyclotransferase [Haloechinothrix aidingensis]
MHAVSSRTSPGALPDRLAVYGTLMRGAAAWHFLAPLVAAHEGECTLPGALYDTGRGYPAYRPGDSRPGCAPGVPAQCVRLRDPDSAWPELDRYEGPGYERTRTTLHGGVECWVYVWIRPVDGMPALPHGWLAHAHG